jgi:hypothetical protein
MQHGIEVSGMDQERPDMIMLNFGGEFYTGMMHNTVNDIRPGF